MRQDKRSILVAPHQFPHLDREQALADEFGLELVAAPDQEAFRAGMANAEIVMVTPYGKVQADEIRLLAGCKAIVRYGIGYDNIDAKTAGLAGVPVSIVPDASSEEVASHALATGLALARRVPQGQDAIRNGRWAGSIGYDAPKLSELEVGVVGMGRIGRHVATWWAAIGAKVRAFDPFAAFSDISSASLADILENSDLVSLHLPLNDDTRNMISRDVLARMRRGAVIVNVSRGGLIDEDALAQALRSGHIAGAALDVFAQEPLSAGHSLRDEPHAILTPHVSWRSKSSLDALQDAAVSRARAALCGQPLSDVVNR